MDKTSSFRCVKFALVAGNAAVILLGLGGFIIGLIDPPFIQVYDSYSISIFPVDYGPQLALVSCIAVVIAAAGLIGALREHFYLLLVYALCIVSVFVFRIVWWATSGLHQAKRFILDITVSVTLLTFLALFFLLIFAILEALTIQNSLPLTRQKFLMLRSKLKAKRESSKKEKQLKAHKSEKSKPKEGSGGGGGSGSGGKKSKNLSNNIYITSSSIYGSSGRRRSPVRMTNGHGHNGHYQSHQHHHTSSSSRARKYLPGDGYDSSPHNSEASHDSNNNTNNNNLHKNIAIDISPQSQPHREADQRIILDVEKNEPAIIDSIDQHRLPRYLSSEHYFRFRSPSPSTPTPVKETLTLPKASSRARQTTTDQPSSLQRTMTPVSAETKPSAIFTGKSVFSPPIPSLRQSMQRSTTPTFPSQTYMAENRSSLRDDNYRFSPATTTIATGSVSNIRTSRSNVVTEPSVITTNRPRPAIIENTKWTAPMSTSAKTTPLSPLPHLASVSTAPNLAATSRQYQQTQRANFFTSPPAAYSASNLFNYSSIASPPSSTTIAPSNLSQTHNLFSTYTSPLKSSSSVSSVGDQSRPTTTPIEPSILRSSGYPASEKAPPTSYTAPLSTSTYISRFATSPTSPPSNTLTSNYLQLNLPQTTNISSSASKQQQTVSSEKRSSSSKSSHTPQPRVTTPIGTPPPSSTQFSRSNPKSYEDYVKSYRYPTEYSTIRTSPTSPKPVISSPSPPIHRSRATDRRNDDAYTKSLIRSGSLGADLESTTTTTFLSKTTSKHREMTESESVYYRQIVREQ